ncbi:alkaline phosphatase D family protein [Bacterioplanoides pacificum]|uniref:Alkaline phosphatase D family protein n=1 Tax=Bacterioplanoides pacificum TaxID=1171596 RepID=A0ABV7VN70_9GAMM
MSVSRRSLLKNLGLAGAAASVAGPVGAMSSTPAVDPLADKNIADFGHGVASGDPLADRVILWTRITPLVNAAIDVKWRICRDVEMTDEVNAGVFSTSAERDYTVKVDADGLMPNTWYYYQFSAGDKQSAIGRTKTAAETGLDRLRLAVVSCSSFPHGYFNVYRILSERNDLDAVVHLGDYIYEYGEGKYDDKVLREQRALLPKHEIVSLSDYRQRHNLYKRDPDLQAVHQQYPFIVTWDDHEFANDTWKDGAENHNDGEGEFIARKRAAKKAYFEWMPVRNQPDDLEAVYRKLQFGNLVDLMVLDTRVEGRDEQVGFFTQSERHDPNRTLLGFEQEQWLHNQLSVSSAKWKICGQQVQIQHIGPVALPDKLGGGTSFFLDTWDGYTSTRRRLFNHLENNNIDNFIVLTGDIHSTWVADLAQDPFDRAKYNGSTGDGALGVEFVTPSVTSPALPPVIGDIAASALKSSSPHLKYCDMVHHGFFILDVTEQRAQADWYFVNTIEKKSTAHYHQVSYKTDNGSRRVSKADSPVTGVHNPVPFAPQA